MLKLLLLHLQPNQPLLTCQPSLSNLGQPASSISKFIPPLPPYIREQAIKQNHITQPPTYAYTHIHLESPARLPSSGVSNTHSSTTSTSTSTSYFYFYSSLSFWLSVFITVSASHSLLISGLPPLLLLRLRSGPGGLRRFTCIQRTTLFHDHGYSIVASLSATVTFVSTLLYSLR
ncbi:hypothetical protein F4680DRAFT_321858 [Xylaria scruposa]|nr:hypothetical protein F4680DRAFT_321858 [Xylaria scruposa]